MRLNSIKLSKYLLVSLLALIPMAAKGQGINFSFANPLVLTSTETPGAWYPDRFSPHGFIAQQTAPDGTRNTLEESINAGDYQNPATSQFYNTQGRKYDVVNGTYSTSIYLYVPASWKTTNARMAGFWGTAVNSSNVLGNDYPIVEFQGAITSGPYANGGVAGFYGWNNTGNGSWNYIGLPPTFNYNSWVEITLTLIPGVGFHYSVSDPIFHLGPSIKSPFYDSTEVSLGNVILQGYNYDTSYNIYWDGLSFASSSLTCTSPFQFLPFNPFGLFPGFGSHHP